MLFLFGNAFYSEISLFFFKAYTKGQVIDFAGDYKGNKRAKFKYIVEDRVYENTTYLDARVENINIGDVFLVKYSYKDPSIGTMEFWNDIEGKENRFEEFP